MSLNPEELEVGAKALQACNLFKLGSPHILQAAQRVFEETVRRENPSSLVQNAKGQTVESGFITHARVKGALYLQ